MHEVNGVDGINLIQLALATSLWCLHLPFAILSAGSQLPPPQHRLIPLSLRTTDGERPRFRRALATRASRPLRTGEG
jgi:hypothetical protein